ncbi:MAG: hypothetical protein JNL44_15920, partial [Gemmatimonadetes bacterium]|nr:hypothetical protein [Gemmatimonadota bacterium]
MRTRSLSALLAALLATATVVAPPAGAQRPSAPAAAASDSAAGGIPAAALGGFRFRSVGPAFTSGRIADIAVHPDKKTWYVGVASGGVWKTENAGTTWSPI